jgi:hypothetical protein
VTLAWLLGAGAVFLAAHLFSDVLAHAAATQQDPNWWEVLTRLPSDRAISGV